MKRTALESQGRDWLKIGFWTENRGCHSQERVQDGEVWQGSVLARLLFPLYIKIVFTHFGLEKYCCSRERRLKREGFITSTRVVFDCGGAMVN